MSFPGCSSSPDSILAAAAAALFSSILGNPVGWLACGCLFLVAVIVRTVLFNPDLSGIIGGGVLHEKGPLLRVEFRVLSFFTLMVWWGDLTFEDLFSVGQFPADPLRIFDQK